MLAAGLGVPAWAQTPELRGFWVDAFHAGLRNATEARQVIADARTGGFNAVFVQVRKRGDAYYRNGLEPVAADPTAASWVVLALDLGAGGVVLHRESPQQFVRVRALPE